MATTGVERFLGTDQKTSGVFERVKGLFSRRAWDAKLHENLERLRGQVPSPVFWLFGKTQSGKTSIIKYLTGAGEAEIGRGFRPCTRHSRQYQFPTPDAPLLTFVDTRGLDEPGYDPSEDLGRFNSLAHAVIVTAKVLDHAQENVLAHLETIRQAQPGRPVVLALTCLHESYPQQQHLQPYPFDGETGSAAVPKSLLGSIAEQRRRFENLSDRVVAIDLTRPEEGYIPADYGGPQLKQTLVEVLPASYRQTFLSLNEANRELSDLYARGALPHIIAYSLAAASMGMTPLPWIDMFLLAGIQTRMVYHLADFYGQPLSAARFLELAGTLGSGMMVRQAARELTKIIPFVGSVASGALAGASTFALGKAFCYYYRSIHQGHVPPPEELRRYYQEQLNHVERRWSAISNPPAAVPQDS